MTNSPFIPAKRENNSLRDFIIVNTFQSKHFPSLPSDTAREFAALGEAMRAVCPAGRCAVVGFAETAVGIGAYTAAVIGERCSFVSTTREPLPAHFRCLHFEESHSHAVGHELCVRPRFFEGVEHVFLVDDEFTTGKTAVKLARALRKELPEGCPITAAAFIASSESRKRFAENGIGLIAAQNFEGVFTRPFPEDFLPDRQITPRDPDSDISLNALLDSRMGVNAAEYADECRRLCKRLSDMPGDFGTAEIIGTEELCLPPIFLGEELEKRGSVRVHSVTRSPMLPAQAEGYPIRSRAKLKSLYDSERTVFLYNSEPCDLSVIITDAQAPDPEAVRLLCGAAGGKRVILVRWCGKAMRTSIRPEDCTLLLKDITGQLEPLPAKKREPLIQSGVHYSELLPAEYEPSAEYLKQYENGLSAWAGLTAAAVEAVSRRIYEEKENNAVLVSLARAGTPVGILVKRCIKRLFGADAAHYSISIIRGRGIDKNAMRFILSRHSPADLQFIDGWTGKGAIIRQLEEALRDFPEVDKRLAVLADPAGLCEIYGTRDDLFIPCSCLNSVVSGLFSRT
ncbi:MAG: phosphoribosyltransferase domain-containing protein, partial [Oscillospiraceae bacterium]